MREITAATLNAQLQAGAAPQLLDVREAVEVARGTLPGAIHIPLGELPARFAELSPAAPTVVYCHHGARSAQAVQFLGGYGFTDIANLAGGTDAWSRQIDPSLPIY